jgi:hypothetical protein
METSYKFSLPYREGMETEPGFVEKREASQKGHEGEKVFAFYAFKETFTREEVKKTDAKLIEAQCATLVANSRRIPKLAAYAKKYNIEVSASGGKLTDRDKEILKSLFELSNNYVKIHAAIGKNPKMSAFVRAFSVDEIKALATELTETV